MTHSAKRHSNCQNPGKRMYTGMKLVAIQIALVRFGIAVKKVQLVHHASSNWPFVHSHTTYWCTALCVGACTRGRPNSRKHHSRASNTFRECFYFCRVRSVIYIYHDHPPKTAMAFHSHSNSHNQSYHSLDGATILSWAHDPDCQHRIACDTIEEGSLNH